MAPMEISEVCTSPFSKVVIVAGRKAVSVTMLHHKSTFMHDDGIIISCTPSHAPTTRHLWLCGAIRKKFSGFIISVVMEGDSCTVAQSRTKCAIPSLSSIYAK